MTVIRGYQYKEITVSNSSFERDPTFDIGFPTTKLHIVNESLAGLLEYSFNGGRDIDGKLDWDDESIEISNMEHSVSKIWMKATAPMTVRVYIWA